MSKRYQESTKLVQVFRWIRYRPLYGLFAIFQMGYWLISGAKVPILEHEGKKYKVWDTKTDYVEHIWTTYNSLAHIKMGWYYTIDEVINRIFEKEVKNGQPDTSSTSNKTSD